MGSGDALSPHARAQFPFPVTSRPLRHVFRWSDQVSQPKIEPARRRPGRLKKWRRHVVASVQVPQMVRDQSLMLSRAKYVRPNQSYCEAPMTVLPVKFSGALPLISGGVRLVRLRMPNMTPMLSWSYPTETL